MNANVSITAEAIAPILQAIKPFAIAYLAFGAIVGIATLTVIGTVTYKILKGR